MLLTARLTLLAALLAPLPALAAPDAAQIAEARQAYLDGDYDSALGVLAEAAEAGNATALNIMGAAYESGKGVPQDAMRAIEFFEQAAAAGEPRAIYNLGLMFKKGSGSIAPDPDRSRAEFVRAAEAGYGPAMTQLGRLHELATPPDHALAADWYEKAHETGDGIATANLAQLYIQGEGRPVDWQYARHLYTQAATQGVGRAYSDLGVMHEHGYGVAADTLTAFVFYRDAVHHGYAKAGSNLAYMLLDSPLDFLPEHATLGYCLWATGKGDAADDHEMIADDCAEVSAALPQDAEFLERAGTFAKSLP